jgi:hypothetical protein
MKMAVFTAKMVRTTGRQPRENNSIKSMQKVEMLKPMLKPNPTK